MRSTLALSLTLLTGCSTSRAMLVQPHASTEKNTLGSERQRIAGYELKSGERLAFDGYVETREDTLRFVRPRIESRTLEHSKPAIVRDIPRDSVAYVRASSTNIPASILFGVSVAALATLFVFAGAGPFTPF